MTNVTLEQLYTEPRFRKMSEKELEGFLNNPENMQSYDWDKLDGDYSIDKARNLIAYYKEHPLKEEKPLRLIAGMGVVNATLEQQRAIVKLAITVGLQCSYSENIGDVENYPHIYWTGENFSRWGTKYADHLKHPVTFRQFCQAILNEPEKPREETVKLSDRFTFIFSAKLSEIRDEILGCNYTFDARKLDELVSARERVAK